MRKKRKQAKKEADRRSIKKRRRASDEQNKKCRMIAKVMTKNRILDIKNLNVKYKCPTCQMFYCLSFNGQDMYCHECPVLRDARKPENADLDFSYACMKRVNYRKQQVICQICRGGYYDQM